MKKLILVLLVFGGIAVQAQQKQSLKDLLFSGKLKKDSTGVVRSTDDLSAKIDTTTKKETAVASTDAPNASPSREKEVSVPKDTGVVSPASKAVDLKDAATVTAKPVTVGPPRTNTKLWREYTDSLVKTLQAQVLGSRQIKKNTYFLMVDYEIAPDGQVTVTNVTSTPENAFLQAQVRQYMDATPLQLNPLQESGSQQKKLKRKQQITITKD